MSPVYKETADIETSSDAYAARFAGATGRWMLTVQERIVLGRLREKPQASVLDVGGGHGQLAAPLCREGYAVTVQGSDAVCRRRIAALADAGRCRFVVGDCLKLPFSDAAFECVLCFRLITHCADWPALIGQLCRVARRAVIVDYPTSQSLNCLAPALFGAKKRMEGNTRAWRLFRHAEIEAQFARHGWRVNFRTGQFFFPMVLHRVLKCKPVSAGLEGAARGLGLTRPWGSPVILEAVKA
jgi:2-polyprenyl-3-methyl-5-hydroxy-6-metoxy-1,4-benzoquinol methylase